MTCDCIISMSSCSYQCGRCGANAAMTYLCALQLLGSWLRSSLAWWPQVSRASQGRAQAPPCPEQPGPAWISQTPPSPHCTSLPMVPACIQLHCTTPYLHTPLAYRSASYVSTNRELCCTSAWVLCQIVPMLRVRGKGLTFPFVVLLQALQAVDGAGTAWRMQLAVGFWLRNDCERMLRCSKALTSSIL